MGNRIKMIGFYLVLLTVILVLMLITFRSLLNSYHLEKYQTGVTKIELQDQLDFLDHQLAKPQDKFQLEALQAYDQSHSTNLLAELKKVTSPPHFVQPNTASSLQVLRDYKNHQIKNIQAQSFFSYIPEWPLLILGVLGVVATRIINFTVDYVKECIGSYLRKKRK